MNIELYNEDCFDTMNRMERGTIDTVMTSPFYNTNVKSKGGKTLKDAIPKNPKHPTWLRYDEFVDSISNEEYANFTVRLFDSFDRILKQNGVVLYNISYGSENTEGMFLAISDVIKRTNFTVADCIAWKKKSAMPVSCSPNKLTRIVEFVFVFCRKSELLTFHCNKRHTSTRPNGQKMYEVFYNYVEARNNDEVCKYNKATYSTELCEKCLLMYGNLNGGVVYDPFMGTGTTAKACQNLGIDCYGSEISAKQTEWARNRLKEFDGDDEQIDMFVEEPWKREKR